MATKEVVEKGLRVTYVGKTSGWENRHDKQATVIDGRLEPYDKTVKIKFDEESDTVRVYLAHLDWK